MTRLYLVPGELGVETLKPAAHLAAAAQERRFFRPPAASRRAGLKVVVAGETENKKVLLRVISTTQDAQAVVDLEPALRTRHSADLALTAT